MVHPPHDLVYAIEEKFVKGYLKNLGKLALVDRGSGLVYNEFKPGRTGEFRKRVVQFPQYVNRR
jgi:hypothetical protein